MLYTSDLCTGGTPTSDGDLAGYPPTYAFDNNTATFWHTENPNTLPSWIKYDFGAGVTKTIRKWTLRNRNGGEYAQQSPKNFVLQGSNDNSNWTDLDTHTNETWTQGEMKTYSFANATAYRYYRLYITAVLSGALCSIAEIELMSFSTNIKSINGVEINSIKSINGVDILSVKSVCGLA